MDKMRVLHISQSWGCKSGVEGISTVIMNLYRSIDNNKIVFDIGSFNDRKSVFEDELNALGGTVYKIKGKTEFSRWFYIIKLIKQKNYDAVWLHINLAYRGFGMFLIKLLTNAKIRILHCHNVGLTYNNKSDKIRYILNALFRIFVPFSATNLFSCSIPAAEWAFSRRSFKEKGKVINNAIMVDKYTFSQETRNRIRKEECWNNEIVLGYVGMFTPGKNQIFLIRLLENLKNKIPCKCVLIGGGSEEYIKEFNSILDNSSAKNEFVIKGVIRNVNEYLQAMDCFIFPSVHEGLGIVAIEAQAAGLPTICSEHIPLDAKCSDLFQQISLNDPIEKWCKKIIESVQANTRSDRSDEIKNHGYDIKQVADEVSKVLFNVNE